jgi:hypothetical protein
MGFLQVDDKLDARYQPAMQLLENFPVFCAIAPLKKLLTKVFSPLPAGY